MSNSASCFIIFAVVVIFLPMCANAHTFSYSTLHVAGYMLYALRAYCVWVLVVVVFSYNMYMYVDGYFSFTLHIFHKNHALMQTFCCCFCFVFFTIAAAYVDCVSFSASHRFNRNSSIREWNEVLVACIRTWKHTHTRAMNIIDKYTCNIHIIDASRRYTYSSTIFNVAIGGEKPRTKRIKIHPAI